MIHDPSATQAIAAIVAGNFAICTCAYAALRVRKNGTRFIMALDSKSFIEKDGEPGAIEMKLRSLIGAYAPHGRSDTQLVIPPRESRETVYVPANLAHTPAAATPSVSEPLVDDEPTTASVAPLTGTKAQFSWNDEPRKEVAPLVDNNSREARLAKYRP